MVFFILFSFFLFSSSPFFDVVEHVVVVYSVPVLVSLVHSLCI